MMPPFDRFCFFLGRIFFPKRQDWDQTKSAKLLVLVLGFSVVLAVVVAKLIRVMYNHSR